MQWRNKIIQIPSSTFIHNCSKTHHILIIYETAAVQNTILRWLLKVNSCNYTWNKVINNLLLGFIFVLQLPQQQCCHWCYRMSVKMHKQFDRKYPLDTFDEEHYYITCQLGLVKYFHKNCFTTKTHSLLCIEKI